jgi:selenocysteine lyase/cysteine desulfurase
MLSSKRSKFTLPRKVTYLNCAYMAPLLASVEKAGIRGLRLKRNPIDIKPSDFFGATEQLRKEFAKTIHANQSQRVVVIPSVSYGMATVAKNVQIEKHQHIIVAGEQFPSNYYCWKNLCDKAGASLKIISPPQTLLERGKRWNESILEAINSETRLVALGHVHWADGTKFQLEEIRRKTREMGSLLIIDGTQSIGALSFDVNRIDPDAVIVAGYKWLLGPYSIGLAYFGEFFDNGSPLEENWINRKNSEDFSGLVIYQDEYQNGSLRYEVGEHSNFTHVPMLLKSVSQLNRWGIDNIQDYCREITRESITLLRENGFWIEDDLFRGNHLFGIRLPEAKNIEAVKNALSKKNIFVSFRGDAIRVSPNVYNTEEDMRRLAKALISA